MGKGKFRPIFLVSTKIKIKNSKKESDVKAYTDLVTKKTILDHDLELTVSHTEKEISVKITATKQEYSIPRILDYMHRIFGHQCVDLTEEEKINRVSLYDIMPNDITKEMLEVGGVLLRIQKHVPYEIRMNSDVNCYVIGDGISPRCGTSVVYMTKWNVLSIDPAMRHEWLEKKISPRLSCLAIKGEEVFFEKGKLITVVICIHSHADLPNIIANNKDIENLLVFSVPCCMYEKQIVHEIEPFLKEYNPTFFLMDIPKQKHPHKLKTAPETNCILAWKLNWTLEW